MIKLVVSEENLTISVPVIEGVMNPQILAMLLGPREPDVPLGLAGKLYAILFAFLVVVVERSEYSEEYTNVVVAGPSNVQREPVFTEAVSYNMLNSK